MTTIDLSHLRNRILCVELFEIFLKFVWVEITLGFLITLPFVCIDWLSLSLIKSKKVWANREPKFQAEQAHLLKFNRFIVLLTTWVTLSSEVSRLKRKRAVFCSVEYRFKIRMSLLVTKIMITFLAGDVCKEDMASGSSSLWTISHNITRLRLSSPSPNRPDSTAKWRNSVYFHVIESNLYQWQKRSLPPAEQATSQEMNYFICRRGVPHVCTRIYTDRCSDGSRWRHINPSKVTVRQIHSTKEKP